ncbi:MAG TPA: hypothetical protein VIM12_20005 [Noviherbaspirillum sp.]|uniref:hypothetical protein n=1 Tax=Noviherbaspirillum sp. TaxID=1926288 RepID=UPI002F93F874
MRISSGCAVAAAAMLFAVEAQAQTGLTASVGTPGVGLHLTVPLQEQFNARFGVNGLNYSHDIRTSNVEYDTKLKLRTVEALLDYHPLRGNFRISGGIVYNGTKLTGDGTPRAGGTYTFNGTSYPAATAGTLDARVDFRNFAPYLGIGFGNAAQDKGWGFSADLGVLFQGRPDTSVTSTGCTAPAPLCAELASDLAAESRELRDDADEFRFYPVVRVGVSYKF